MTAAASVPAAELADATATTTPNDSKNNSNIQFVDYKDESQLADVTRLVVQDLSEPYSIFTYRYFLTRFPDLCIMAVDTTASGCGGGAAPVVVGCVVGKIDTEIVEREEAEELEEAEEQEESGQEQQQHEHANDTTTASAAAAAATTTTQPATTTSTTTITTTSATASATCTSRRKHNIRIVHNTGYVGMLAVSANYRRRGIAKTLVREVLARMRDRYQCESVTLETEVTNTSAQRLYQQQFGFVREELLVRYYLNWNDAYRLRLWF